MIELEDLGNLGKTTVVSGGFICNQGLAKDYRFLQYGYPHNLDVDENGMRLKVDPKEPILNPFEGDLRVPFIQFLKVHDGHPVVIAPYDSGRVVVCSEEKFQEGDFLNKAYFNKEVFDLTSFMRIPYPVRDSSWNRIYLTEEESLLYLEGESAIEPQGLTQAVQLEPSQIFLQFSGWLRNPLFAVKIEEGCLACKKFTWDEDREKYAVSKAIKILENQYDLKLSR